MGLGKGSYKRDTTTPEDMAQTLRQLLTGKTLTATSQKGRLIRERVMEIVDQNYHVATDDSGEDFVWLSATQRADWNTYRLPATEGDVRQVDAIPAEELRALALSIDGENKISEMARSLGIKRLTSQARQRLESIL